MPGWDFFLFKTRKKNDQPPPSKLEWNHLCKHQKTGFVPYYGIKSCWSEGLGRLLLVDLLKLVEDRLGELESGGLAAHVASEELAIEGEQTG